MNRFFVGDSRDSMGSRPPSSIALIFLMSLLSTSAQASLERGFPSSPDPELTPGALCERPSQRRYAEGIPYCDRDVESETKREVMQNYDRIFGYRTTQMQRSEFKIDHFIPLCMGGSNREENLWPQHRWVYEQTDPLESVACQKMAQGRLLQKDAVALIREAKLDLRRAPEVLYRLRML